eukprot:11816171-Alexandrium_andersonii.AAC.1
MTACPSPEPKPMRPTDGGRSVRCARGRIATRVDPRPRERQPAALPIAGQAHPARTTGTVRNAPTPRPEGGP